MNNIDINRKGNYLAIEIFHERYCFETNVMKYFNKSLAEIAEESLFDIGKIKKHPIDNIYTIDECEARDIKYNHQKIDDNKLVNYNIDTLLIIDWDDWIKSKDLVHFIFGKTENKYGLLDLKGE